MEQPESLKLILYHKMFFQSRVVFLRRETLEAIAQTEIIPMAERKIISVEEFQIANKPLKTETLHFKSLV